MSIGAAVNAPAAADSTSSPNSTLFKQDFDLRITAVSKIFVSNLKT